MLSENPPHPRFVRPAIWDDLLAEQSPLDRPRISTIFVKAQSYGTVSARSATFSGAAARATMLAAARADGYERYLPSQMGHLGEQGKNKVVNMHGCETRLIARARA